MAGSPFLSPKRFQSTTAFLRHLPTAGAWGSESFFLHPPPKGRFCVLHLQPTKKRGKNKNDPLDLGVSWQTVGWEATGNDFKVFRFGMSRLREDRVTPKMAFNLSFRTQ